MPHPNLSDKLNSILERGGDPDFSLDLRKVNPNDIVAIHLEGQDKKDQTLIFFQVDKPAGPGCGEDSAEGTLIDGFFSRDWLKSFIRADIPIPPIGQKCAIVGACTKNPGAPLGLTMLQLDNITIGRQLSWYMPADRDIGWISWDTVRSKAILDQENFQRIRDHLENDEEFGGKRLSLDEIEEIRREVAAEREEKERWQVFIKQPLRVETRNSVYLLGPEAEDGTRTLQKEDESEIWRGRLVSLHQGHSMIFDRDDRQTVQTSTVISAIPI